MASQNEIDKVWEKAKTIDGKDPDLYRKDRAGNQIYKPSYGKNGPQSWQIDHENPVSKGGSDSLKNKQPLQSKANQQKSDKKGITYKELKQKLKK